MRTDHKLLGQALRQARGKKQRKKPTGRALVDAMQASPYRDIEIEPQRLHLPVQKSRSRIMT
jgi:hypothetical protein